MRLYIAPENESRIPGTTSSGGSGAHYKPDFIPGIRRERLNQMASNGYESKFSHVTVKRPNLLVVGGILYILYSVIIK